MYVYHYATNDFLQYPLLGTFEKKCAQFIIYFEENI